MAIIRQVGQKQFSGVCQKLFINRSSTNIAAEPGASISRIAFEKAKPFKEIPGYKLLPIVGTSWIFMPLIGKYRITDSLQYEFDRYEKFGPISRDRYGKLDIINITEPCDCEWVFRNDAQYPTRLDFATVKTYRKMRKDWYTTIGVTHLNGKEWYDLRFRLQKNMMKTEHAERFVSPFEEVSQDFVKHIIRTKDHNNEVPDFMDQLLKWALESVGYIGLDRRLGCLEEYPSEEGMKIVKSVHDTFALMNKLEPFAGNTAWWKWFSTPTWRKFVRTMDFFSEVAFKYAYRTLEDVQEKIKSGREEEMTMVMSMLATKDLDISGVATMVVDMLMAGVDTTSHSVGYLLYALAKAPEKQEKLHQEIRKFLPNLSDRITPEVLRQMTYVKSSIKESQRLYPITKGVPRTLDRDIVLSGYQIPAGTVILCNLQVTQRQEKHFKDANKFIPERWMDEKEKSHPFAFLPFGFGTRSCIGRRLAELEMQCVAIEIFRRFKVEYHYEDLRVVTKMVNLAAHPLRFTFLDRTAQK